MNLVHEICDDFPVPEFCHDNHPGHSNYPSCDDLQMVVNTHSADFSFIGASDLLDALEEVAQQVSELMTLRPPSLSLMERSHALDLPAGMLTPWEDIFDFVSGRVRVKTLCSQ
jgi:hypothetical protein